MLNLELLRLLYKKLIPEIFVSDIDIDCKDSLSIFKLRIDIKNMQFYDALIKQLFSDLLIKFTKLYCIPSYKNN